MVLEDDGSQGIELAGLVGHVATGVAGAAALVLVLALVGEALRRRGRARRVVALLDRVVPGPARAAAVALVAVAATLAPVRPLAADESVRGWLGRVPTPSTPSTVVTPDAIDELVPPEPAPAPAGPMVLVPDRDPDPAAASRPPVSLTPPVAPPTAPAPPPPDTYVVRPGDCLWSIAEHRLGPDPDPAAVDRGWRAIYDLNRAAVGIDPGLIHPGLVLRLPPLTPQP
jgi:nucleoid-associated protein YgaU